jgi:hypothetical protein
MIETGSPVFDDSGGADHYEICSDETRFCDGRVASIRHPKGLYSECAAAQSGPRIPAKRRATKSPDGNAALSSASGPDYGNVAADPASRT